MIDIHTHILPNMDDGARDVEEAKGLISLLKAQGVDLAVLTPHYYPHQEKLNDFIQRRKASYETIADIDFKMILGSETYLSEPLLAYSAIEKLCIGETNYLLLELPYTDSWGSSIFKQIDYLIAKFRVQPIIAHVERYQAARQYDRKVLQRLVDQGCLLQFNIKSVVDKSTRRETLKLLKEDWANFIGSDCHNLTSRPPLFDDFYKVMKKKLGAQTPKEVFNRPQSINKLKEFINL